ncbi:che-11, partial [Pristionchus pacificus]
AAIQNTPSSFNLINSEKGGFHELRLQFQVKGIFLADKQLVVWSSETIAVMDVQSSLVAHPSTSFHCSAKDVALVQQTVITLENDKVNMRTLQGTVKQQITVPEMEGDPFAIHVNRTWLVLATTNNFLRVYDLSKREARQQYLAKGIDLEDDCVLAEVRINVTGTRVAATFGKPNRPDGLIVWDAESDSLSSFSFKTGLTEEQQLEEEAERATSTGLRPVTAAARRIERDRSRFCLPSHKTGALQWDEVDPRFLVVEARPENTEGGDSYVMTALATSEFGLLPHALQIVSLNTSRFIGVSVPNVYFIKNKEIEEEDGRSDRIVAKLLIVRTLQEFAGIEDSDSSSRDAMLNFCLFLTLGRIDDAFKAIKFIRSEKVWQQMASMSVKARRLDVATVCLGHMGEARAAAALRRAAARGDTEKERCALLALYLGMLDEAESLYIHCRRWDMVVKMFVARLKWTEALKLASQHTRIDEKRLYHQYAKFLEEKGDINGAIENYERAGTHVREVTRMLCRDYSRDLEAYVRKKREPELQKWWASWLEITGNIDGALNFYAVAEDIPSIVRILLHHDRLEEAIAKAEESNNPAAFLIVARNCEGIGRVEDAVNLYSKANAISSAIRLAQENNMVDKLATLCLMAGPREMANGAAFYEDIAGHAQTAVMLYHKAGMIGRALDVAYRTEQYNAMDMVTMELTPQSDKTTLERAGEFFLKNQNYEKAAELLAMAQKLPEAIRLCDERNVRMTEKLTNLLTPTKESYPDLPTRKRILCSVGELCVAQGAYQAAAKKFAQAGAMVEAISALIRSSDTSRIMAFASIARNKEVYIMAANYLQTTNWREDVELCKSIENFYNKAQAYDHLSGFYMSCAQMELDEVGALPQAIHALEEAEKVAAKSKEPATLINVRAFQSECTRMLKILRSFEIDPADALRQLRGAQVGPNLNLPETIAVMVKALAHDSKWKNAWSCIEELIKRCAGSKPTQFVPRIFLDQIADEVGQKRLDLGGNEGDSDDGELEEVDFSHQMKRQGI